MLSEQCLNRSSNPPDGLLHLDKSQDPGKQGVTNIYIRTFGFFDIFVNGRPIAFRSAKEKEFMALLVDRRGGTVSTGEGITVLYEACPRNKNEQDRYRKLIQRARQTLERYGVADLIVEDNHVRSLNRDIVTCDYFEFLDGNERYQRMFAGSYLSDYSWAEATVALLMNCQPDNRLSDILEFLSERWRRSEESSLSFKNNG